MRRRALLVSLLRGPALLGAAYKAIKNVSPRDKRSRPVERFYAIGHRGAAGLAPENTLAAFANALALGVDAIEMDVHLTADGEVVIYHDPKLKPEITRTADGRWLTEPGPGIREMRLRQLRSYDVGRLNPRTRYAWRYSNQRPVDGERIPTLGEVIALAKKVGNKTVQFWIEIKTSPLDPELTPPPDTVADAVITVLHKAGVTGHTVLLSFDWRPLVHAQTVVSGVATAYLSRQSGRIDTIQAGQPGASPWMAGFDVDQYGGSVPRAIHAAGGRYWLPNYRELDRKQLEEAYGQGLKVIVWTPNGRNAMRRLIEMGVDGIITDRPDLLREVLTQMSLRP